ncbi:CPBP family intramembrane metalloprotease [Mesobacillus maritimus]|uniref:CPBP family intramembrane glutamic endopeptidase n=1 Tax=Mesobacillus maritimus TaxID=1643336 RepID=UPI00203D651B|nr:type II CAAX endopeptidase family protein [Mesobacillus maritimus]MCM3586472.1 CPBP family intramembrane metalloprotease [Mesobacillus maritimus]
MKKDQYREVIKGLTDKELLFHLYLTQGLLLIVSFFLGLFLFDSFYEFLTLFQWADPNIWQVGALAGLIVVAIDMTLMRIVPARMYDDGGLNQRIFQNKNIIQVFVLAAIVAISEEILFRGVIQTHFGLIVSSIIFALVHYRYLFNWFLFLNIVILSFVIGFIYMRTGNLSVTILMHFTIDFLLGLSISRKKIGRGRDFE